jgi:hypothetical protein
MTEAKTTLKPDNPARRRAFPLFFVLAALVAGLAAPAAQADTTADSRYIVKFAPGISEADQASAIADAGASDISEIAPLRLHSISVPVATEQAAVDSLKANANVADVEADRTRDVSAVPSDPDYGSQWSLSRIGWDQVFGSVAPAGTSKVAILDTGVDAWHPDLAANVVPGTSILDPFSDGTTDANGHGTEMAGIVAASADNGIGMAGIGYAGVTVMPVQVLDAQGTGQDSDIIQGIVWAADHGADVILMSFSNPGFSQGLQDAVDYAWSKGAVVVAAAGNDGADTVNFPAGDRGVVGVANTDENDALNSSSNYGQDVFMAAPGTNIYTTSPGGGFTTITGTSASAAEVAGAAALIRATDPSATNDVIDGRLAESADPLASGLPGNGRLNIQRALTDASSTSVEPVGAAPVGSGGPFIGPYTASAAGNSCVWNGSVSTAWTTAANWSSCGSGIPGANNNDTATIPSAPANQPVVSTTPATGPSTLTINSGATVTVTGGTLTFGSNNNADLINGTLSVTGGAVALGGNGSSNDVVNGAVVLNGGTMAAGNTKVTFAAGSTLDIKSAASAFPTGANVLMNAASTTTYSAAANQSVAGVTYGNLTLINGGTKTAAAAITVGGAFLLDTGTTFNAGAGLTHTFRGNFTNNGTFTPNTSTATFSGGGAQSITGATTFNNFATSGTGTSVTPSAALTFNGSFTIAASTSFSAGSSSHTFKGNFTNGGTFTAGTSTATFSGGGAQSITGATTFNTFATSGAGTAVTPSAALMFNGNFSLGGGTTFNAGALSHTFKGDFSNSGTFTAGGSTATFSGGVAQTILGSSSTTFNVLALNNSAGVSLSGVDATASNLQLGNTVLATGTNRVVASGSVTRGTGFVEGNLQKPIPVSVGTLTRTFEVGTGSRYAPIDVSFASVSAAGDLTVSSGAGEHSSINTSGINPSKDVNRYWTLTKGGALAFSTYSATFSFAAADVDAAANTANFIVKRFDGTNWNATTAGTRTAVSTQATGLTAFGSFAVGETDSAAPTSAVTFPTGGAILTPANYKAGCSTASIDDVCGTAADETGGSGVSKVEVAIQRSDGMWWNGLGFVVNATPIWNLATGTTGWSYAFTPAEDVYTVTSRATDAAGNVETPAAGNSFKIDNTVPTGSLAINGGAAATNSATVTLNLSATDANGIVSYRVADGPDCSGASFVTPFTAVTAYSANVSHTLPGGDGSKTVCVQYEDAAGNDSATSTASIMYDTTKPDVTVEQAVGQADPTNAQPIHFTAQFSEHVNGFTSADVSLGGTADHSSATVTVTPGSGNTYDIAVGGLGSDGTVTASIGAATVTDDAGNDNKASTSTDNSVTYDTTKPNSVISFPADNGDYNAAGFDDGCTPGTDQICGTATDNSGSGVALVEVSIKQQSSGKWWDGSGFTASSETFLSATGTGTWHYDFTPPADGSYTIHSRATDEAGNVETSFDTTTFNEVNFASDTTKPDVTVEQAVGQADPTNAQPIHFTAQFSEHVSGFTNADVTLGGTAEHNSATVTVTAGSGNTYDIAVDGLGSDGTVTASIGAAKVTDDAGNDNNASTSTDNSVTYDTTKPDLTVNQASTQDDPTNAQPIHFTADFSEHVNGFTSADVSLGGSADHSLATVTVTHISGNSYDIAVDGLGSDGTVTALIGAGKVTDDAGNDNNASTSTDNSVTYDATNPDVTVDQTSGQADPTNGLPIHFTAQFSEHVTGFTSADVTLGGTADRTSATVIVTPGSGNSYDISVDGLGSDGTVTASIGAAKVTDDAGNSNNASTSTDNAVTYDTTNPDVTVEQASTQDDPTNSLPIHFTADFSQHVNGFTASDVTLGGTAGHGSATVTVTHLAGNSYDVSVDGLGSDGTVTASIGAATVTDDAGNDNNASTSTDNSVTYDTTQPNSTISFPTDGGSYNVSGFGDGCTPGSNEICGTGSDNSGGSGLAKVEISIRNGAGDYWDGSNFVTGTEQYLAASGTPAHWSYGFTPPADDSYTIHSRATDNAGNVETTIDTAHFTEVNFQLDTSAPGKPSLTSTTPSSPANNNDPAVNGTAEANSTVKLYTNSSCTSAVAGSGQAGAGGNFSITVHVGNDTSTTYYATATDAAGNVSDCSTTSVTYLEDSTAPTVTNVTSDTADGAYKAGTLIPIKVTFSEPVTVNTVIGTPRLALNTGAYATYASGSGSGTLTFNYTVASPQNSSDLDYAGASSLETNGGSIVDGASNGATLTLPTPGTTHSLGANKSLVIDTTPPTITLTTPADGASYTLSQVVAANYACGDPSGSGIAAGGCTGPAASGASIDTATGGSHTFTVNATDKAGNTASQSATYSVSTFHYTFTGFFAPVSNTAVNVVKAGSTVPVKFSLGGDQGLSIFADGYPKSQSAVFDPSAPVDTCTTTDGCTVTKTTAGLTYDAVAKQYVYTWQTDKSWVGNRQLVIKLADGTYHWANFQFK